MIHHRERERERERERKEERACLFLHDHEAIEEGEEGREERGGVEKQQDERRNKHKRRLFLSSPI